MRLGGGVLHGLPFIHRGPAVRPSPSNKVNEPMREKSSDNEDPLAELLRANPRPPPKREADLVPALPFYDQHPEWARPRKQTRRSLRRRIIREG
jgi:hypothetical protein